MASGITSLSDKQSRLYQTSGDRIVSRRLYNFTIGAVILYGVIINVLMSWYLAPQILSINPVLLLAGYIILVIAGSYITYRSSSPLVSFIGYNLVCLPLGAVITICVQGYSTTVVAQAFMLTAVITGVMMLASTAFPGTFAGMGRMLFIGLIGIIIANLVCLLFGIQTTIIAWIAAVLFSLYIGYDWVRAQQYVPTLDHAVDSALDIYVDIVNLFLQLLTIMGRNEE
ncbi:MAG: Bax inhibitor-1 family protein [Anaerovoracaceae bacterium]|jgi:FtsH-binding integral membrane protein